VVGLLASALYDPVWTGAVKGPADFAVAAAAFAVLVAARAPPVLVVALTAAAGMALGVARL
jgi:chromate transporter